MGRLSAPKGRMVRFERCLVMSTKSTKFAAILETRGFQLARPSKSLEEAAPTATWDWEVKASESPRKRRTSAANAAKIRQDAKKENIDKRRMVWKSWNWQILEKNGGITTTELRLTLDEHRLRDELERLAKRNFGMRVRVEIADGVQGESWALLEFVRSGDKSSFQLDSDAREEGYSKSIAPIGLGGVSFRFCDRGKSIGLEVVDIFGFGILPQGFAERLHKILRESLLGGRFQTAEAYDFISLNEIDLDPGSICFSSHELRKESEPAVQDSKAHEELLRRSIGRGRWTISKEVTSWKFSFFGDVKDVPQGHSFDLSQPLNVLEAREVRVTQGYIDRLIDEGKSDAALEACLKERLEHPNSLFLLRRIAMLSLVAVGTKSPLDGVAQECFRQAFTKDPKDLLFASTVVQTDLSEAFENDKSAGAGANHGDWLDHLSMLGAEIHSRIVDPDSLASFEVVLPEFLGDLWWLEDLSRAQTCYLRILDKRGDLPRVLWKLVQIAKKHADPVGELKYLKRLLVVEQRYGDLARIHLRMGILSYEINGGLEEAIGHALKALDHDPGFMDAATFSADLLERSGRFDQAVGIFDGLLRKNREQFPLDVQAMLEVKIGDLWYHRLNRADLGEGRYQSALRILPESLDVLLRLRDLYRSQQRYEPLSKIYATCMEVFELQKNKIGLREAFEDQVRILRDNLKDFQKLGATYDRVGRSLLLKWQEIDEILELTEGVNRVQWQSIFEGLRDQVAMMDQGLDRAKYLSRLGAIARDKLADPVQAKKFLLSALDDGYLEAGDLQYLQEQLLRCREFGVLADLLERYALIATPLSARQALLDLLSLPEFVSDVRKDQIAVKAYLLDPTSEVVILQRLQAYRRLDYAEGLIRLLDFIWVEEIGAFQKENWARKVIDAISEIKDENRFRYLEGAFGKLLQVAADRREVLQEAVLAFKADRQQDALRQFTILVLEENLLPPLEPEDLERLLINSPKEFGRYLTISAHSCADDAKAVALASQALDIFRNRVGYDDGVEQALAIICGRGDGPIAELVKLREMVEKSQHWELLAQALRLFGPKIEDRVFRAQLYLELGEISDLHLEDPIRAKQAFEDALSMQPGNPVIYWSLAQIAAKMGDDQNERDRYLSFLSVTSSFESIARIETAISRLEKFEGVEVNLFLQIGKLFPLAVEQNRSDILAFLTTKALYISGVAGHSRVNQFLEIGKLLADSLAFRARSLIFYKEAMRLDVEDDRIWLPLYFLLREFGSDEERLEHLRAIIPSLEQDRRPFKSFPITIETLHRDRQELERQLEGSSVPYQRVSGESPSLRSSTSFSNVQIAEKGSRDHSGVLKKNASPISIDDWDEDGSSWREALGRSAVSIDDARKLSSRAFGSALEKHLAIQALAVRTGDAESLQMLDWQVWKDPRKMNYSLNAKSRIPERSTPTILREALARLVIELTPLFSLRFSKKLRLAALPSLVALNASQIVKQRRLFNLSSKEAVILGLDRLSVRFSKSELRCFDLPGLKSKIFFDGEAREFYLDLGFWLKKGGSELLHAILQEFWSVKLKYFVPLALDPVREVFPLLLRVRQYLGASTIGKLKFVLSPEVREIGAQLRKMNQEMLREQFRKMGAIEQGQLLDVWEAMRRHVCMIDLADTLDLIGILSSLTGVNIDSAPPQKIQESIEQSPELLSLIRFCGQLRLES